jgi:nitrogen fixation-related uncharacterized protein
MIKKFFLCGMIALLSASLFFWGCPTGNEDDLTGQDNDQIDDQTGGDDTGGEGEPGEGEVT